ncbi:MAG: alpha-L-arabinofuranosidase C-terminal domain-containing protein [Limisphaerales bacterium]
MPAHLTGKFTEHLGANVYGGISAFVLANPTFGVVPFRTGSNHLDGGVQFMIDEEQIDSRMKLFAARMGWPAEELESLARDRRDSLATYWGRVGSREGVLPSPDTAPSGSRAQRIGVAQGGQGIAQWTYLPAHRTRDYEFEVYLRSPGIRNFSLTLSQDGVNSLATAKIEGVSGDWKKYTGVLTLQHEFSPAAPFRLSFTADSPGQFVVQRILLQPTDHIGGVDPDVLRLLKQSKSSLQRWPGGNFVSAYRWRDGVGPREMRPTVPNFAWGGIEPNLFGTDEFIPFCRAIGAEPLICVNAGNGTPEEAARWVEYCNGSTNTPMGQLRAENGHPEPYNVRHWEIGNELWGKWQVNWTTPQGNVDRYRQFSQAMLKVDPTIELYGCGTSPYHPDRWNNVLISSLGSSLKRITDHTLFGGVVGRDTNPLDIFSDYMASPEVLEHRWNRIRIKMKEAGVVSPRLAVTEAQIFARLGDASDSAGVLNRYNLVDASTQAEALFSTLLYHTAVRVAPFLDVITHSATVNHGGGLRKYRERVYANPCYYSQSWFADLVGSTPVAVEIESSLIEAPLVLPDIRRMTDAISFSSVDAIATVSSNELWLSIVHRGTNVINLQVDLHGYEPGQSAELRTLSASVPWSANDSTYPERVAPVVSEVAVRNRSLSMVLNPYSVTRVRIPKGFH